MKQFDNGSDRDEKRTLSEEEINSPEFDPREFAPAPEKKTVSDPAAANASGGKSSMVFAILCAALALILAVVGTLCAPAIASGRDRVREETVLKCFDNCSSVEFYNTVDGCDVYAVLFREKLAGYAAYCTFDGFGGESELLVCFDTENKVTRVKIISDSESDGLGDKVRGAEFLKQFKGLSSDDGENIEIDLVSRATASSNAVKAAVQRVLDIGLSASDIADTLQIGIITADEIEEEVKKDSEKYSGGTASDDRPDTGTVDSDKLTGRDTAENNNTGKSDMDVDGSDVTTVYETETKESETTAETAAPDTTEAPATDKPETTAPPAPVTTEPETTAEPETSAPDTADTTSETETAPDDTQIG